MMRIALLFSVLVACGGGKSAPEAPAPQQGMEHHEGGGAEHENLSPELKGFHDVLAPRYHLPKGPDRQKQTCDAIPDFKAAGAKIATANPAGVDPQKWTDGAAALAASIDTLATTCAGGDAAKFEADFEALHTNFHKLMEASMHE